MAKNKKKNQVANQEPYQRKFEGKYAFLDEEVALRDIRRKLRMDYHDGDSLEDIRKRAESLNLPPATLERLLSSEFPQLFAPQQRTPEQYPQMTEKPVIPERIPDKSDSWGTFEYDVRHTRLRDRIGASILLGAVGFVIGGGAPVLIETFYHTKIPFSVNLTCGGILGAIGFVKGLLLGFKKYD